MEAARDEIRDELEQAGRDRAKRRVYSAELKAKVVGYVVARERAGTSRKQIAREIGIHNQTFGPWVERRHGKRTRRVRRVRVASQETTKCPVVVLPRGVRIEGLSVDQIVSVVKALT